MRTAKWIVGIGILLVLAAAVAVAGQRADRHQNHDWGLRPYVPEYSIGVPIKGTVLDWKMDAYAPLGWAIVRDENGNYWKVRYAECDRVPGLTCQREILFRYAIKATRTL